MFFPITIRRVGLAAALLISIAGPLAAQQSGTIAGRVVEPSGTPVAGATVVIEDARLLTQTDDDGSFVLSDVPAGVRRVRVDRIGYHPAASMVAVTDGAQATLTVELTPAPVELAAVNVIGSPEDLAEVRAQLARVPGSVDLIELEELERTRLSNFTDVLRFTPGVWIQPRFGAADESQLSIRGSGLRNNFHLRGVNVLVNGMPYRNADGFTDFESLELLTASHIQVHKGGNALRYGGSTLGGAINMETKTGYTASPFSAFAEGGSFGFLKGQLASGDVIGGLDYYGSYAYTGLDGFRAHGAQRRDRVNAHLGALVTPRLDLRGFYFFAHVEEDLPGSLTREEMEANPRAAAPTNVENDWGRDYALHHLGVQLRSQLTANQTLEVSPYFQIRNIVHPIFRVLDQESRDIGLEVRYENSAMLAGRDNHLTVGFQPAWGDNDNRHFQNVGGQRGALAKDQRDVASGVALYAEDMVALTPRLSAVLGVRFDHTRRSLEDDFLTDGDQSDERTFEAILPKVGLLYDLAVNGQIFGNVSRSYEPPLLLELNSLTGPGFIDLDAQDAWQFELGVRGHKAGWHWEASAYEMELRDEILNTNVRPFPGAPFTVPTYRNAPKTRHYGLELGLDGAVTDEVALHLAYTFGRFDYVDDPEFEGNEIPGAPHHAVQAGVSYDHPSGLSISPNVEWVPGSYFVDSANTVENEGWTTFGLRGEWRNVERGFTLFLEGRNLTDELYSPAVTVDDAAGRFFLPADGRSVYAGVRWER